VFKVLNFSLSVVSLSVDKMIVGRQSQGSIIRTLTLILTPSLTLNLTLNLTLTLNTSDYRTLGLLILYQ